MNIHALLCEGGHNLKRADSAVGIIPVFSLCLACYDVDTEGSRKVSFLPQSTMDMITKDITVFIQDLLGCDPGG